jgi:Tfp pilus assembly protein PilF
LNATINLAMKALKNKSMGEALNELNKAHDLVNARGDELEEWKAEMAAAWAVYYYHAGEKEKMSQSMQYALRREPDNKRISALRRVLKGEE